MNGVSKSTILQLSDGLKVVPLDANTCEQEYLAILPNGRHYRLTSRLKQFVECIDGQCTLAEISTALSQQWERSIHPEQVWELAEHYLAPNGLLRNTANSSSTRQPDEVFSWRIKLLSPRHIRLFTHIGQRLFAWPAVILSLVLIAVTHVAMYTQANNIGVKLVETLGNSDFLLVYGLIIASVLSHEIGHASACRRFGEAYGDIGFGIYLIFPVFYADVTRIWKLSRWQRVIVDLGGMYFQLLTGVFYYLIYRLSGNWLWLLASVQIDILILLSFNPIAKFDGYWLVSDLLGIPNLHRRLTGMVKRLLGRPTDNEIALKPSTRACLWVYLFLFSGIIVTSLILGLINIPEAAQQLAGAIDSSLQTIGLGWQSGNALAMCAGFVRLISPLTIILGLFLLLLKMLRNSLGKVITIEREV